MLTGLAQADALHLPLADQSVDLVMTSPPYADARLYLAVALAEYDAYAEKWRAARAGTGE